MLCVVLAQHTMAAEPPWARYVRATQDFLIAALAALSPLYSPAATALAPKQQSLGFAVPCENSIRRDSFRCLHRQNSQGRKTGGPPGGAGFKVRTDDQPQDCPRARPHDPADGARARE